MTGAPVSLTSASSTARVAAKGLLWELAKPLALSGLYPWTLEADWLSIEHVDMPLPNLGSGFDGARVVHLSDLHASPLVGERYLRSCMDIVNSLRPDFVVLTGDFVTFGPRHFARTAGRVLGDLAPAVATLAVLGNHDYGLWHPRWWGKNTGLAGYLSEHLDAGRAVVLNNACRTFRRGESALQFVGVEDLWAPTCEHSQAFSAADASLPTIALAHNPDAACDLAERGADWILSGHTHGKPTPDTRLHNAFFPTAFHQFVAGRYALGNGSRLYVNRGLGHSRRHGRQSRPEITVFTLRSAQACRQR